MALVCLVDIRHIARQTLSDTPSPVDNAIATEYDTTQNSRAPVIHLKSAHMP